MITSEHLERFLAGVRGQALREGTRYSTTGRVHPFVGTLEGLTTVVAGKGKEYEVALWLEDGRLAHRCSCPSWRDPCKHEVAAALSLRSGLAAAEGARPSAPVDPEAARAAALEERRATARRERLDVRRVDPPFLAVAGASGYEYRVQVRGGPDGPHGCECPDFEANRLHTCKHVERVRAFLAGRPRVRRLEARRSGRPPRRGGGPRLFAPTVRGASSSAASSASRAEGGSVPAARAFEDTGILRRPMDPDEFETRVEPSGARRARPAHRAAARQGRTPAGPAPGRHPPPRAPLVSGSRPIRISGRAPPSWRGGPGAARRRDGAREDGSGDPRRRGAPPCGASRGARDDRLPREPARRLGGRDPQVARRGRDAARRRFRGSRRHDRHPAPLARHPLRAGPARSPAITRRTRPISSSSTRRSGRRGSGRAPPAS